MLGFFLLSGVLSIAEIALFWSLIEYNGAKVFAGFWKVEGIAILFLFLRRSLFGVKQWYSLLASLVWLVLTPTTVRDDVAIQLFARSRMLMAWLQGPSISLWVRFGIGIMDFAYFAFWVITIVLVRRKFTPRRAQLASTSYLLSVLQEWMR
jgi:hypothetical protein